MKRIIFESAPEFIVVCVLVGLTYAGVQYYRNKPQPWSNIVNWTLFGFRAALVAFLAFLLLGPIVKQVDNLFEKPVFIVIQDNSVSVREATDSTSRKKVEQAIRNTKEVLENKGYESSIQTLTSDQEVSSFTYRETTSDINNALRRIGNRYEGRNVAGVILVSDGIYNSGLSPLYSSFNFPVYTVGLGDTSVRSDIAIKNVAYNKIAYQGNKFPLRAEVQVKNINARSITVSLLKRGRVIDKQTKDVSGDQLVAVDFQPTADEQGIQKYDVQVDVHSGEYNTRNNRSSAFIEVVEGKKKILVVASSPHPDIKAIREVVEKNSNYEFLLHVPGISEQQPSTLQPDKIDLAVFHQSPDLKGKTNNLYQTFANSKTSLFLVIGQSSDLNQIARTNMPLKYESLPRDYDEVTPVVNTSFSNFTLSADATSMATNYPPVSVPFGKIQLQPTSTSILYQRVGSVQTEKPLLIVDVKDNRKVGVMIGEGLWRWRLNEYDRTENTTSFDEIFGKLIQFLSTTDDKRKFRSYPVQQEFSDNEAVVFESQVYNDIFEPVYGNTIDLELTDETGLKKNYNYVTSPGNTRYQIGGLKEGVYRFRSRTNINGKTEEVRGEFAVVEKQSELQNLTADFDLLRKLSSATGGKFYPASQVDQLQSDLQKTQAKSLIHSEETYDSIINLKWVFFVLLVLVSAEWALRKFYGSY
jgi:hypothetical protein